MPRRSRVFRPHGSVAHVRKGVPYHKANSLRGIGNAARLDYPWIDLDLQMTKDGVVVICHWPRPLLRDGFHDPAGKIGQRRTVSSMTFAEVRRLRAGGYRIQSLEAALKKAGQVDIGIKLEPKGDRRFRAQKVWDDIAASARRHGVHLTGYTLRANSACIPFMRRAGIKTTELRK